MSLGMPGPGGVVRAAVLSAPLASRGSDVVEALGGGEGSVVAEEGATGEDGALGGAGVVASGARAELAQAIATDATRGQARIKRPRNMGKMVYDAARFRSSFDPFGAGGRCP